MSLPQIIRIWPVALCLIGAGCGGSDINEVVLQNLEDARSKGFLREGGWLPAYLPSDSSRIRLRYDIDTNEVWVAFESNGSRAGHFEEECKAVDASEVRLVRTQPRWWPETISKQSAQVPDSYTYYNCIDGGFVALSRTAQTSYCWFHHVRVATADLAIFSAKQAWQSIYEKTKSPPYSKESVARFEPYTATLRDGVWRVRGNVPPGYHGETLETVVRQSDANVSVAVVGVD